MEPMLISAEVPKEMIIPEKSMGGMASRESLDGASLLAGSWALMVMSPVGQFWSSASSDVLGSSPSLLRMDST